MMRCRAVGKWKCTMPLNLKNRSMNVSFFPLLCILQGLHNEYCQAFCTHLLTVAVVVFLSVPLPFPYQDCQKVTNSAFVIVAASWPDTFLLIRVKTLLMRRFGAFLFKENCTLLLTSCKVPIQIVHLLFYRHQLSQLQKRNHHLYHQFLFLAMSFFRLSELFCVSSILEPFLPNAIP